MPGCARPTRESSPCSPRPRSRPSRRARVRSHHRDRPVGGAEPAVLPGQPLPGRSRGRPATRPRSARTAGSCWRPPTARSSPGRSRSASRGRARSASSTRTTAARRGRHLGAQDGHQAVRPRDRRERDPEPGAVVRHDRPVPARPRPQRQEGLPDRADRPELGARARARHGQRHLVAREPRARRLPGAGHPVRAARPARPRAVPLPVPDRAADLQRDADHDAEAAEAAP